MKNKQFERDPFPAWDEQKQPESLNLVYQWAIKNAEDQYTWYAKKKPPIRFASRLLRFLSILLAGIGALCPLIEATKILERYNISLSQWGYVFLATAAGIAAFDFYFGYSTNWMRYIVTQISIERALKEFQYDWILLKAQENDPAGTNTHTPIFLQRAKDFTLQIENLVKQETDAWISEFQSNISQLEKVLKTEIESRKPGSIRVAITNCADFDKVSVRLNDNPVKELVGVTEGILNTISPGRYEIAVIGKKGNKESKASKVVEVQANTLVSAEFTL